jgi:hypothetical protein
VQDDDFLSFVNAGWEPLRFQIPAQVSARGWEVVCDTFDRVPLLSWVRQRIPVIRLTTRKV